MEIWTTTVDCICGDKHSLYAFGEEIPSGHYVYKYNTPQKLGA